MNAQTLSLALAAATLAGCAARPTDSGFAAVQADVSQRVGGRVQWNRTRAGGDAAVATAVRRLLEKPLGADEAVQLALLNNRELQATFEELGIAQADLVQAGLLKNPILNAAVEFAHGGGTRLQFSVVENFLDLLQLPLRKHIAKTAFEGAKLRVTGAVLDLAGRVRAAVYTQQAAEQLAELRRTVAEAAAASYDLAQRLHDAGNTTDLDLSNEQAQSEQAKLDADAAEAVAAGGRERLYALLGLWGADTRWSLARRLDDPPAAEISVDAVEQQAVERSLDLALAKGQIESAARALGVRQSFALLPEAEAGVASEKEVHGPWEVGPAISLPLPLFDTGQSAVAGARARWEQSRARYDAMTVEVRAAARAARVSLLAARERALRYQRVILPLRHRIVEQTQLRYNGMLVGAFQLLQARQNEVEAAVGYVEARRDYWLARARLEQVVNGRISNEGSPTLP